MESSHSLHHMAAKNVDDFFALVSVSNDSNDNIVSSISLHGASDLLKVDSPLITYSSTGDVLKDHRNRLHHLSRSNLLLPATMWLTMTPLLKEGVLPETILLISTLA